MNVWILATIVILFVEGLMLAINPDLWKRTMRQITELPSRNIRRVGVTLISAAFALLFLSLWIR